MPTLEEVTTLNTSTAQEKFDAILIQLSGLDLVQAITRLESIKDVANSYIYSDRSSEDTRLHWVEILTLTEDLSEYCHRRLARHAEQV